MQSIFKTVGLCVPSKEDILLFNFADTNEKDGYKMIMPTTYDRDLAVNKGLIDSYFFNYNYFYHQALYRLLLENYLQREHNLLCYDEIISNYFVDIQEAPEDQKDFYQKYSALKTRFIYLRNNIHIERLGKKDLDLLKEHLETAEKNLLGSLMEMIQRTYVDVIRAFPSPGLPDAYVLYGPDRGCAAPEKSLVLQVCVKNYDERIERLVAKMSEVITENSPIPVTTLLKVVW